MQYEFILVERRDRVTTIILNRPGVLNAINPRMHEELQSAFDDFQSDVAQYVCVVTGAGERAFCVGSDLVSHARGTSQPYPRNGYAGLIERFDLNKPVIAMVNGLCLGGGFEIALACDIIIAADHAEFGLPEPLVGAVALGGGIHRLVRQIGEKRAIGFLLTGARFPAAEAYKLGLVNEVAPIAALRRSVDGWCERILAAAPLAVRATKETARRGLDEPSLQAALQSQSGYPAFAAWRAAEDTKEGPRAFAEKRKPIWKGR